MLLIDLGEIISITILLVYLISLLVKLLTKMNPENAKFLLTNRKPGTLDVHLLENIIILNYTLEVQVLDEIKDVLFADKKDMKKLIVLQGLNSRSDCNLIAKEVLSQCDLIHPSRLIEVEQMIYYLKKRTKTSTNDASTIIEKNLSTDSTANISQLNEYIELLYDAIPDKIRASYSLMNLAKDPDNLEYLSKNETALSAIARVLREDWKKNGMLTTNLIYTFFCFSSYSNFRHVILQYKIGSLCMDIIDSELSRTKQSELGDTSLEQGTRKLCPTSASMYEIPRSRIPEPVRPKSGHFVGTNLRCVMDESTDDFLASEYLENSLALTERTKGYKILEKKQEHVLRVAFYLLLNIAEDEGVEEKMCKRNIIPLLISTLDVNSEELLTLVVTFLKKLSVIQVNKEEMIKLGVVQKMARLLNSNNADLVLLSLKLLFNLSFDHKSRISMVDNELLHKFVSLLSKDDRHQETIIKLLYQLSYDREIIPQFFKMKCISLMVDMLLLSSVDYVDRILMALCINLATHAENAEQMVDSNRLHSLLSRALQYQDELLMKLIRNISEHDALQGAFIEFVGDIAQAIVETKNDEFLIECLGILSNLKIADLDWAELFNHFKMINKVKTLMSNSNVETDMILQIIVLLGTAAYDEGCALLFCNSDVVAPVINLLRQYQEDDEVVLQIMYMFLILLSHDTTADYIVNSTEVPAYLIDLLLDSNDDIRKVCNSCLNMITEKSNEWGNRIRVERFRSHNAQWLQMVDSQSMEIEDEENDELPPYLNTEYLSTATIQGPAEICNESYIPNLYLKQVDEDGMISVDEIDGQSLDDSL